MAKEKFTPGPWMVRNEHGLLFVESPKKILKTPYGQQILGDDYFGNLDKLADCNLVAAAPQMCKALQMLSQHHLSSGGAKISNAIEEILSTARGERAEILANMMAEDERDGLYNLPKS